MPTSTFTVDVSFDEPPRTTNVTRVQVGGGGGGGAFFGGGGGGGGATNPISVGGSPGTTHTIVVSGTGGAGGTGGGDGGNGGSPTYDGSGGGAGGIGGLSGTNGSTPGAGGTDSFNGGNAVTSTGGGAAGFSTNGSDGVGAGAPGDGGAADTVGGDGVSGSDGFIIVVLTGDPPSAPTGLAATSGLSNHVPVSWDSESDIDGYRLYRSDDGYTTPIYDGGSTSFDDTGLTNGVTYTYKIASYAYYGEGSKSSSQSGTPAGGTVFNRSLSDSITLAHGLHMGDGKLVVHALSILSIATATVAYARTIADTLVITDVSTRIKAKIATLSDSISLIQSVARSPSKVVSDSLIIIDAASAVNGSSAFDLLCIDSEVNITLILHRSLSDNLGLGSFAYAALGRTVNKNYNLLRRKMKLQSNIHNVDIESVTNITDHTSVPIWMGEDTLEMADVAVGDVDRCQP